MCPKLKRKIFTANICVSTVTKSKCKKSQFLNQIQDSGYKAGKT